MKSRRLVPLDMLVSSALDHVEPSIGTVTGALGSELSTVVNGTSNEIPKVFHSTRWSRRPLITLSRQLAP